MYYKIYNNIIVRDLGLCNWEITEKKMIQFTKNRNNNTIDEIWLVEHFPIYTIGKKKLNNNIHIQKIPIRFTNRGGKITYHGPGQQIMYILLNLKRYNLKINNFINIIEKCVIKTLKYFSIFGRKNSFSPGIYVNNRKICSYGIQIQNGFSLHGLALNVCMDLKPFNFIDPCGNKDIQMTQMKFFKPDIELSDVKNIIAKNFIKLLK